MRGAYITLERTLRERVGPVEVERTQNPKFGDFTTNAPFKLARERRQPPPKIAQEMAESVEPHLKGRFSLSVAGGYINFRMEDEALGGWTDEVARGRWESLFPKSGVRILVEFISANPTGPLNVANARAGAVGDSIVRILKLLGYDAESEYYVNDAGMQIVNLGLSILHFIAPDKFPMPEDGYRGDYVRELAREFVSEAAPLLAKGPTQLSLTEAEEFGRKVAHRILQLQKETLRRYGIHYDNFVHESWIRKSEYPERTYAILRRMNLLYFQDGHGEISHEVPPSLSDLYDGGTYRYPGWALYFKSTLYGDDKDRVVVRSNGQPTYFFWDAAYHLYKLLRGYEYIYDIFGPDHHGYIPRMKAVMRAFMEATGREATYDVIIAGQVNLYEEGRRVRMSKRAGRIYTLDDLMDEVGKDAVRFFMLLRAPQTELNFDLTLAKKAVKENPVFYTQYAHARIRSLLDYAEANGAEPQPMGAPLGEERDVAALVQYLPYYLIKTVPLNLREGVFASMGLPSTSGTTGQFSPNLLVDYLIELAHTYHRFYQNNRIVGAPRQGQRLTLSEAVMHTVKLGLNALGVEAPDRMD
ncbi:MAG: arginine--tRNA ligase [Thermotogae bacterium]|nr:arginine--tRNA ligase [Thermotogota bacterium]